MEIIIGKEGNQPFAIGDPNVSRHHAKLIADESKGTMTLIDTNSTNGTFIHNGSAYMRIYPNQPYKVGFDTMIRLGPETCFHIKKLFQQQPAAQKPAKPEHEHKEQEKVDISHLSHMHDSYMEKKAKYDKLNGAVAGMRSMSIIGSLGGGALNQFFGLKDEWWATLAIAVIILVLMNVIISLISNSIIDKKNLNEKNYKLNYCCPKCRTSFAGKYYENILANGHCPNCKAKYYDSNNKK